MLQLGAAVLATIAVVIFAMSNTHHVALSLALGAPLEIRLVTLLFGAFFAGVLTAWMRGLAVRAARQAERKRRLAIVKRGKQREVEAE